MKKALIALVFPLIAHAQTPDKVKTCRTVGLAFTVAIQSRDFGLTPQQAHQRMQGMTSQGITDARLKSIINAAYFAQPLADVHGDAFQYTATSMCLHPESLMKPLK